MPNLVDRAITAWYAWQFRRQRRRREQAVLLDAALDMQREAAPDVELEAELCSDCTHYPATVGPLCWCCNALRAHFAKGGAA